MAFKDPGATRRIEPPNVSSSISALPLPSVYVVRRPCRTSDRGGPLTLSAVLMEDLNGANIGFALCPMLSFGAIEAVEQHGSDELKRDYFGMHRFEFPGDVSVEFHLNHGDWVRLLRANGFEITDLVEIQPPEGARTRYKFVDLAWCRRWPCEEVWKATKRR